MSETDPCVSLCQAAIARITQSKSLIATLERSGYPLLRQDCPEFARYSDAWKRIDQVLAQIPEGWETDARELVGNLLHYGVPERQLSGTGPERIDQTWQTIVGFLSTPASFFTLEKEVGIFRSLGAYVTAAPLTKGCDRIALLTFVGLLTSVEQSLSKTDTDHGAALARQSGVIAAWVERYQLAITRLYVDQKDPGPADKADEALGTVLDFVNAFPKYIELSNALRRGYAALKLLQLAQTLAEPATATQLGSLEVALAKNARARREALDAEVSFTKAARAAQAADPQIGNVDETVARIRSHVV
jgi:hypothetical protein